ncbi:hypothetical protein WJX74_010171 [Apatococcus lobatus]|uniref:Uncharacterized protein n=1 Tax=Apatococcus lobatus TaxID=904363 RepID=A0AAW1QVW2_9CHLO
MASKTLGLLSFEPNSLLQAADVQIASLEKSRAMEEASWDGYCGLVKVGEEEYGASLPTVGRIDDEDTKDCQRHQNQSQTAASPTRD